jgi:hypothetical protein
MNVPTWWYALAALMLVLGVSALVYTWQECGWKTLMLGSGGFYNAVMGLCD